MMLINSDIPFPRPDGPLPALRAGTPAVASPRPYQGPSAETGTTIHGRRQPAWTGKEVSHFSKGYPKAGITAVMTAG